MPGPAGAQQRNGRGRIATNDAHMANLAVNAAIGAATAIVRQVVTRRPLWPAALQGAGGGLLMGAGKAMAGSDFAGSGLAGRQIHAIGIALVGAPSVDSATVVFPLGPLHIGVHPGSDNRVRARIDLFDLIVPALALMTDHQRLDARASYSAGTPVFVRHGTLMPSGHHAAGLALGSTVFITDLLYGDMRRQLIAHETIHVLQWDAYRQLLAHPVERAAVRRVPGGRSVVRRMDLGLLGVGSVALLAPRLARGKQFWEQEAQLLSGQSRDFGH